MMELYHGTDCIFSKFNLKYADNPIRDFGAGIYLGFSKRHAKSAGARKASDRINEKWVKVRQPYLFTVEITDDKLAELINTKSQKEGHIYRKNICDSLCKLSIRVFGNDIKDKEEITDWAYYVFNNRQVSPEAQDIMFHQDFDIVVGPVADSRANGVVKRNKGIFLDGTRDEVYNLACKYLFSKNVQLCAKSIQAVELINSFLKGVAEPYD